MAAFPSFRLRDAVDAVDLAGAALLTVTVVWIGLAAGAGNGDAGPVTVALAGAAAVAWIARQVTRLHGWLVPLLVYAAVAIFAVDSGTPLTRGGPLGYANASAALYFLAAAAALMVFVRCSRPLVRVWALWAAVVAGVLPWLSGVVTAALLVCALPLALTSPPTRDKVRFLMAGGALLVFAVLATTVLLGASYGGDRTGLVDRVVDATLSERRVQLWRDALAITESNPAFGIGPGRFDEVSPTALANPDTSKAHNEYLQMSAETGFAGFALSLGLLLWGFARLWSGPGDGGAVVAAVALTGVGVHASIDYILHFTAVAVATAALTGAGSAAASSEP
ncbi:MAG: O-antigen ligase family protein [Egibacteraceae bacterium]